MVEGKGRILIPGLIDSHCHVGNLAVLRTLTSFGVTTAINMACSSYSLCNSLKHQAGLASFISAGVTGSSTEL